MKTIDIISDINIYLQTENKQILTALLEQLQTDYRHEEAKKQGGNVALKRQKIAEKVLKANQKENKSPAFFKCFIEKNNGETMQIFGNPYFLIALKEEYKTGADTHTPEEMQKFEFRPSKFFNTDGQTFNKIDFDITDIKQKFAEFKAEQKQRPTKQRGKRCVLPIGNTGYNAEFFIDIIEVLGADATFCQNDRPTGISYFESEYGKAILCPCKL